MYSEKVIEILKKKGIEIGDKIKIVIENDTYSGILMPKTEFGNPNCLIIKMSNGYNIGLDIDRISSIELEEKKKVEEKKEKKEEKKEKKVRKDDVVLIGVGGTIACKVDYRTGAVYPSLSIEDITLSFPELKEKNMRVINLMNIFSENMQPKHWVEIAKKCYEEIKKGAKGLIILHGTDTMHYTSAALSFMLKTPVPIVLVGSQRSSDRGSSDNYGNLISSFLICESDIGEIGICMHGSINDDFCYFHRGTKVRKMHSSRRNAFQSINTKPIAKIYWEEKRIEILSEYKKRGGEVSIDTRINDNVGLIYVYPGIKEKVFDVNYDGIVIAGTGLGHVPEYLIKKIKELAERIPVVIVPQTIFGRINMNVYSSGRDLLKCGVIGNLCDFTPETALVKLMIATARYKKIDEIKKFMETNICGEISERSIEWQG